jgi:hypothetical protein
MSNQDDIYEEDFDSDEGHEFKEEPGDKECDVCSDSCKQDVTANVASISTAGADSIRVEKNIELEAQSHSNIPGSALGGSTEAVVSEGLLR